MGASRYGKILAALALFLALAPAVNGQGSLDAKAIQRDADAGKMVLEQWIKCTQAATAKLAITSQERAEVIATAVFGVCSSAQEALLQHFLRTHMTVPMADEYISKIKDKIREHIVAQAVVLRAKSPPD